MADSWLALGALVGFIVGFFLLAMWLTGGPYNNDEPDS